MLKPLIKGQTIRIDDHRRCGNVIHDWNDKTSEVHIHKKCNYNGKEYEIIIPLNQNNPARCISKGINEDIPRKIIKEVNEVFSDADCRERFLEDVLGLPVDLVVVNKDSSPYLLCNINNLCILLKKIVVNVKIMC